MLAQRNATLNKAVAIRMELSRDERLRLIAEAKEKARRDAADLMWGARQEGRQEERTRIFTLMREGYTPDQIETILNAEQNNQ